MGVSDVEGPEEPDGAREATEGLEDDSVWGVEIGLAIIFLGEKFKRIVFSKIDLILNHDCFDCFGIFLRFHLKKSDY